MLDSHSFTFGFSCGMMFSCLKRFEKASASTFPWSTNPSTPVTSLMYLRDRVMHSDNWSCKFRRIIDRNRKVGLWHLSPWLKRFKGYWTYQKVRSSKSCNLNCCHTSCSSGIYVSSIKLSVTISLNWKRRKLYSSMFTVSWTYSVYLQRLRCIVRMFPCSSHMLLHWYRNKFLHLQHFRPDDLQT